jgi:cathepsin L
MYSKIAVAALLAVAAVLLMNVGHHSHHLTQDDADIRQAFERWIVEHGKTYTEEEKVFRYGKFMTNYLFIQHHNSRFDQGLEQYDLAVNKFADLDRKEFKATYTGLKRSQAATLVCTGKVAPVTTPPESVDWTTKGIVTPIKDQGQCGSCWAFSATGALEGLGALEKGKLHSLSEQQLVDCAGGVYTNEGCNGGDMDAAMWYVIDNGITNETLYPYKARDQKCAYKDTQKVYQIKNCAEVTANKTAALVEAVATQPVSISVEADQSGFQFYKSGVFNGKCGTDLDHGILLVGYGTQNGTPYWKAKNSWGAGWGGQGFILLGKGADGPGVCGILIDNTVPLGSV